MGARWLPATTYYVFVVLTRNPICVVTLLKGMYVSSTARRSILIISMSSAKPRSLYVRVIILFLTSSPLLIAPSNAMMNNRFECTSPYFKPSEVTKDVLIPSATRMLDFGPSNVVRISLISLAWKPCSVIFSHNSFLFAAHCVECWMYRDVEQKSKLEDQSIWAPWKVFSGQ